MTPEILRSDHTVTFDTAWDAWVKKHFANCTCGAQFLCANLAGADRLWREHRLISERKDFHRREALWILRNSSPLTVLAAFALGMLWQMTLGRRIGR